MPDIGRWNGMDQLSETYHSASPYAYVLNNPIMMFDPDGRSSNWWDNVWTSAGNNGQTTYTDFDSNGNWGSATFSAFGTQGTATAFYNFLNSGQTGNFSYWTDAPMPLSTYTNIDGNNHQNIQGLVNHNVTIKDNGFWNDVTNKVNQGLEYLIKDLLYFEVSGDASMGSFLDIELKNGLGLNIGKRSTIADFWYIKDAGQIVADYGAETYYQGEKRVLISEAHILEV